MQTADWYFDFVSPYAYFGYRRLAELGCDLNLRLRPVLLAGLLDHWDQKGPAEIPAKRRWIYRACVRQAERDGVPFVFPAGHPFNPLVYLRLAIAAGYDKEAIGGIFDALWTTGADPADPDLIARLAASLGVEQPTLTTPKSSRRCATKPTPRPRSVSSACLRWWSITSCSGARTPRPSRPLSSRIDRSSQARPCAASTHCRSAPRAAERDRSLTRAR